MVKSKINSTGKLRMAKDVIKAATYTRRIFDARKFNYALIFTAAKKQMEFYLMKQVCGRLNSTALVERDINSCYNNSITSIRRQTVEDFVFFSRVWLKSAVFSLKKPIHYLKHNQQIVRLSRHFFQQAIISLQ